jgi:hypothetical protein
MEVMRVAVPLKPRYEIVKAFVMHWISGTTLCPFIAEGTNCLLAIVFLVHGARLLAQEPKCRHGTGHRNQKHQEPKQGLPLAEKILMDRSREEFGVGK